MSQEYYALNANSVAGIFGLSKNVFETIAEIAISECPNAEVAEAASMKHAIVCKMIKEKLTITANIKVKYGTNVNDICTDIQERIYNAIFNMSEIKIDNIDIKVVGFIF